MKKITVSVGIPAYNEERNIGSLLTQIVEQKHNEIIIKHVWVLSDRSTDNTNQIVKEFQKKNPQVKLIINKKRLGKSGSTKKIFALANRQNVDIQVILDADLTLKDGNVLENLSKSFKNNSNLLVACGITKPATPINFIQKVGQFGITVIDEAINNTKNISNYYYSTDQLVAIKVKLLDLNEFKKYSYTHDEFFFLLAVKYKKDFKIVRNAVAYYKLPNTLNDYYKQMLRFLSSQKISSEYFVDENVSSYTNLTLHKKLHSFILNSIQHPFIGAFYILLQTYIHVIRRVSVISDNSIWETIKSTK